MRQGAGGRINSFMLRPGCVLSVEKGSAARRDGDAGRLSRPARADGSSRSRRSRQRREDRRRAGQTGPSAPPLIGCFSFLWVSWRSSQAPAVWFSSSEKALLLTGGKPVAISEKLW